MLARGCLQRRNAQTVARGIISVGARQLGLMLAAAASCRFSTGTSQPSTCTHPLTLHTSHLANCTHGREAGGRGAGRGRGSSRSGREPMLCGEEASTPTQFPPFDRTAVDQHPAVAASPALQHRPPPPTRPTPPSRQHSRLRATRETRSLQMQAQRPPREGAPASAAAGMSATGFTTSPSHMRAHALVHANTITPAHQHTLGTHTHLLEVLLWPHINQHRPPQFHLIKCRLRSEGRHAGGHQVLLDLLHTRWKPGRSQVEARQASGMLGVRQLQVGGSTSSGGEQAAAERRE